MNQIIESLLRLTQHLLEPMPLGAALRAVVDTALEIFPGDHASIRVLDNAGERLLSGARTGAGQHHEPMTFNQNEGLMGWIVQTGKSARLMDAGDDDRFKATPEQGFSIRALIAAPLWSAGKVVGVLGVTSAMPGVFTEEDEVLALLLANCAAPSIERARLEHLTITDHLTMAYNRRYLFTRLEEEMERALRQGTPLYILSIDLDHFKEVNDVHGHATGDMVLQRMADRVRASVRVSDVLVRRGGDEFVLIMPNLAHPRASVTSERLRRRFSNEPLEIGSDERIFQTVSIGVASWDGKEPAEDLESRADAAMYEAKRRGRDRVVVARRMASLPDAGQSHTCPRSGCTGDLEEQVTDNGQAYLSCTDPGCNTIVRHTSG